MNRFSPTDGHRQKCFARPMALALGISLALSGPWSDALASGSETAWLDPAEIDRAVANFTGAAIGEVGGARASADPRLRLANCAAALTTRWHGTRQSAVQVECAETSDDTGPWRIFVATLPRAQATSWSPRAAPSAPASPIIKRGDPVTVVVRGRGFTVQHAGEAIEAGHLGDWIGVRTARRAEPVRARIERPGLVAIPVG